MAKIGDTTFFGVSRTVYKFGVFNPDSVFNDRVSAVYVVSATNEKGQHQPLYVGETDKLGIDLPRHKATPLMRRGTAHVCVHLDDDEMSRRSKRSDLIAYYPRISESYGQEVLSTTAGQINGGATCLEFLTFRQKIIQIIL